MKRLFLVLLFTACAPFAWAGDDSIENRIGEAMVGDHRSEANIERNPYRHPLETLTFFGLEDGMTVMEIWPGGGWYTDILAPVMNGHGAYIAASWDVDVPDQPGYRYRLDTALKEKFAADPELYGEPAVVGFSPPQSASLGEADSVDMVLTFRNTHGWVNDGLAEAIFAEFARVLKPGGVLGVVQHRADNGTDPAVTAEQGYVSEEAVIAMATAAGLVFEASSEINANPNDSKEHEFGVWTLPPSLRACRDIEDEAEKAGCQAKYQEIGESDRMTLRFRKPLG
jgi:predicted methyltransferase